MMLHICNCNMRPDTDTDLEGNPKIASEVLSSKDNGSILGNPSTSLDDVSVSKIPLTSNRNIIENPSASENRLLKNLSASKNNGNVLEHPLTSKENRSVLEKLPDGKDNGSVFENPLTSKDNGSVLEHPLASKDNESVVENPSASKNNGNNHEEDTFHTEVLLGKKSQELNNSEDTDVDIMERVKFGVSGLFEANNHDATESSSSFGDTVSEYENGSSFSDLEVNSQFFSCNTSALAFGGCGEVFQMRKNKKLTDHWRRFIHPIKWRCRWIELQWKELNSQTSRYGRELAQYDQRKQFEFELENHTLEEVGAKALPFCSQVQRTKVMKRKKRKRVEDTIDIASHMSHHNLFSYFENERSFSDGTYMDDNGSNPVIRTYETKNGYDEFGVNDEWLALQFRDDDDSLEKILWKIDAMQSQVRKLRTRADMAVSEIPKKFSSINMLSLLVPCDALASSQDPVCPPYNGDRIQSISECDMGDLIMPDSAVSSHGEVTPLLNMIGSTYQPLVGASNENTGEILINNLAAEEGLLDFEKARNQPVVIEEPQVPQEKQASTVPPSLISEADQPIQTSVACVDSSEKSVPTSKTNAPNRKRKRGGRRKAGVRRWSKRSSG